MSNPELSRDGADRQALFVESVSIVESYSADVPARFNASLFKNVANVGNRHADYSCDCVGGVTSCVSSNDFRCDEVSSKPNLLDAVTDFDTLFDKYAGDGAIRDSQLAADILSGSTGPVFLDDVVSIERRDFSGHVFNLETGTGFYTANGIITHNCRSTSIPILKSWRDLGIDADEIPQTTRASMDGQVPAQMSFEAWLKKQSVARQDTVLGEGKAQLWRDGKITFRDLLDQGGRPLTTEQVRAKAARK